MSRIDSRDAGSAVLAAGGGDRSARLAAANETLCALLRRCEDLEGARERTYQHLERVERHTYSADRNLHPLELALQRDCVLAMRCVIAPAHERATEVSALDCLWKLVTGRAEDLRWPASDGFVEEMVHLLRGLDGRAGIYGPEPARRRESSDGPPLEGRQAALARSLGLDEMAQTVAAGLARYPSGLDPAVAERRAKNRDSILRRLDGSQEDWADHHWHLEHLIVDPDVLFDLIEVPGRLERALRRAVAHDLPFGLTPYYASLIEPTAEGGLDHAVRAQVIPPPEYVAAVLQWRDDGDVLLDFMGEGDTSPVDLVTRRYPGICVLKPYNACAQVCVYCQRNWEIDGCMAPEALAEDEVLDAAIDWIAGHPGIGEVLVTGGDPMVMREARIERVLARVAAIEHVYRIRIGTRTPVVLPMRWTDSLADTLARFHEPGRREVAVVTHFEHPTEITADAMAAVGRIRSRGMSAYNQQVFTVDNSRRFETAKLRLDLRSIGVDPYYCFNAKGKDETRGYRVPIARILQERKEEARLLPGLDRTDEPVFNVPRLGKSHLRAGQDRALVMIRPDGRRVYEFHPWEKNIATAGTYLYDDVPILEYLEALETRGEDPREYSSIWYYY